MALNRAKNPDTASQTEPAAAAAATASQAQPAAAAATASQAQPAAAAATVEAPAAPSTPTPGVASSTNLPAAAASTAVAVKFDPEVALRDFAGAMPPVEIGVLPKIVAVSGIAKDKENNRSLGRHFDFQLVSFNPQFVVSPGIDDDDAKGLVKYSNDGVTIDSTGESVKDYLDELRKQGYADAAIKEYLILIGIVEGAEDAKFEGLGQMVMVQCSPQSRKKFLGYRYSSSIASMRKDKPQPLPTGRLRISAEAKTMGGKDFTQFDFRTAD